MRKGTAFHRGERYVDGDRRGGRGVREDKSGRAREEKRAKPRDGECKQK
jgi:hypothetical protein